MQLAPTKLNKTPMSLTDVACNAQTKPKDRVKHPAQDGAVGTKDKIRAITVHFSTNFSQYSKICGHTVANFFAALYVLSEVSAVSCPDDFHQVHDQNRVEKVQPTDTSWIREEFPLTNGISEEALPKNEEQPIC